MSGVGVGAAQPSTVFTTVAASCVRLDGFSFAVVAGNSPTTPVTRTHVPGAGIWPFFPAYTKSPSERERPGSHVPPEPGVWIVYPSIVAPSPDSLAGYAAVTTPTVVTVAPTIAESSPPPTA